MNTIIRGCEGFVEIIEEEIIKITFHYRGAVYTTSISFQRNGIISLFFPIIDLGFLDFGDKVENYRGHQFTWDRGLLHISPLTDELFKSAELFNVLNGKEVILDKMQVKRLKNSIKNIVKGN
jgi:hypothetical protein